ncbi:MAG TPA: hypothetical protein VNY05_26250 [Candidatus Acidoferrales bacterium]|jgi:hypothetical protein|nr:hypothetical protein [Candidatus Acidoferrales bacterium]
MIPDEIELIVNHALSTNENLRVAIKVGLAFHSLKARIISDFLSRLKSEVAAALGGQWTVGVESDEWLGLWIQKKTWPELKSIGVGSENTVGRNIYFWVTKLEGYECVAGNALLDVDEALKSELDELVGRGSSDKDNAWWRYSPRHRNWDSEEALLALAAPDATDYWKHHLIQIAEIVARLVPA